MQLALTAMKLKENYQPMNFETTIAFCSLISGCHLFTISSSVTAVNEFRPEDAVLKNG